MGRNVVNWHCCSPHIMLLLYFVSIHFLLNQVNGDFITCYTNAEGTEETRCSFSEGYSTCYTTYDKSGQVTGRGCSTTDRICVGENTVQSRHLDGFMSSLGCKTKERIGHLYRGRDCENNVVDDTFERKCYCRYHWCNHPDYYYGGGQSLWQSSWIVFSVSFIIQHCFR